MKTRSLVLTAIVAVASVAAGASPYPRLRGTFVQLTRSNAEWDDARWDQLFARFRELGLSEIVIQWSALDDLAFYPSATLASSTRSPVTTILRLADRADMTVRVGLAHDSLFWTRIERDPALVDVYLRRLQIRSQGIARELAQETRSHPSFSGWYLPEEIDDVNWTTPRARDLLIHHVRHLTESLHALSPSATAMILETPLCFA